jgi:hypothetical protein
MLSFKVIKQGKFGRYSDCYFLIDNNREEWVFGRMLPIDDKFIAFLKVPKKYESIRGTKEGIPFFKEVESEAIKVIKNYQISRNLTPKTAETFKELIDEL